MSVSGRIAQVLYVHLVAMNLTKRVEPPRTPRTQRSEATLIKPTITRLRKHSSDGLPDFILAFFAFLAVQTNAITQPTSFILAM
jgi:hypothetical protein